MTCNISNISNGCIIIVIATIIILPIIIYHLYKKQSNILAEHYSTEIFDSIKQGRENDSWNTLWTGKKIDDCYGLSGMECLKYSNCGLCMKDGKAECIPGDEQGPLFKEDCQGWAYSNYYDKQMFGERVTTITPPWSMFYSDYEARYPSPTSRATLQ